MSQLNRHSRTVIASGSDENHLETGNLPNFDSAKGARTQCVVAVSLGAVAALSSLISGICILSIKKSLPSSPYNVFSHELGHSYETFSLGAYAQINNVSQEFLTLAINVVLTFCIDSMMFTHSVSLRWALYNEQRLEYNNNLRLFTSSKKSGPNRWYINVILAFCLVLSYASTSILIIPAHDANLEGDIVLVNATALITLGIGLAGQAAIAVWCMVSGWHSIPSWSSNPLNTALAAITNGDFTRCTGRCMLSVHQRHQWSNQAVYPKKRQASIIQAQHTIRYILAFLWVFAILSIAWPIIVAIVSGLGSFIHVNDGYVPCSTVEFKWEYDSRFCYINFIFITLIPLNVAAETRFVLQAVTSVLFVCAVQAGQTIGLHCVELVVNILRDEAVWRQAYKNGSERAASGASLQNPFRAAISSPQNIILFVAKAGLHWIIGQGMHAFIDSGLDSLVFAMIYSRLIIYAVLALILVIFTTYLALRRPNGCQPATLGHLQTLADLIDDWGLGKHGRIWWGGKNLSTCHSGICHAGTSSDKTLLSPICMSAEYR